MKLELENDRHKQNIITVATIEDKLHEAVNQHEEAKHTLWEMDRENKTLKNDADRMLYLIKDTDHQVTSHKNHAQSMETVIHDLQKQFEERNEQMQEDYEYTWEDFTMPEDIHFRCEGPRCRFCGSDAKREAWEVTEFECQACFGSDCSGLACGCYRQKQSSTGKPATYKSTYGA